jgi:hypothetical protein
MPLRPSIFFLELDIVDDLAQVHPLDALLFEVKQVEQRGLSLALPRGDVPARVLELHPPQSLLARKAGRFAGTVMLARTVPGSA